MNRSLAALSLCAFGSLFLLGGCQKPADQQSATDANSSAPSSDSSTPKAEAPKAEAPKAEAPRPRPIVVPADTVINVVLDEPLAPRSVRQARTSRPRSANPLRWKAGERSP